MQLAIATHQCFVKFFHLRYHVGIRVLLEMRSSQSCSANGTDGLKQLSTTDFSGHLLCLDYN